MFIVALLLVVFRSLLAPLLTLAPAVLVTQLAGPVIGEASKAGLQVSSLTQIMLLILTLGAGTDYGLFLVFRVREELRAGRAPPRRGRPRRVPGRGVDHVLRRDRHRRAAHAAAGHLRAVLQPGRPAGHRDRAHAAGRPHPASRPCWPSSAGPRSGRSNTAQGTGRLGWWGRTAGRIVTHPAATLALRRCSCFGGAGHGRDRLHAGRSRRHPGRPRAARTPPRATRCSPPTSRPPAATRPPCCCASPHRSGTTRPSRRGAAAARRAPPVQQPDRPARRQRGHPHPGQLTTLHATLGDPRRDARRAATGQRHPACHVGRLPRGKPVHQPRRADRPVRRRAGRR